jgi:hypothetical protein
VPDAAWHGFLFMRGKQQNRYSGGSSLIYGTPTPTKVAEQDEREAQAKLKRAKRINTFARAKRAKPPPKHAKEKPWGAGKAARREAYFKRLGLE